MPCVDSSAVEEVTAQEEVLIVVNERFLLSLTVADNGRRGGRRARNSFTSEKDVEKLTALEMMEETQHGSVVAPSRNLLQHNKIY